MSVRKENTGRIVLFMYVMCSFVINHLTALKCEYLETVMEIRNEVHDNIM
jgi:hypothetical protein